MTDEERKELLAEMRYYMDHGQLADLIAVCGKAADEILPLRMKCCESVL